MAELSKTQFFTSDGIATATVLDTVGPDRMMLYLLKGAHSSRMVRKDDKTEVIERGIKDLLVFPFTTTSS